MEHKIEHQLFQNHAQAAGPDFAGHSLASDGPESFVAELQAHVLELKQPLVLLDDGVFGAREDLNQREFVQIFQHTHYRQAANKFRNQTELDQVFRLHLAEQFEVTLAGSSCVVSLDLIGG